MKYLKYIKYFLFLVLFFIFITVGPVLVYRFVPVPYTLVMFLKPGTIEKQWVNLKDISPTVKRAIIRAEDGKFYLHRGFDFEAIEKAMKFNKTHKRQKGASTISQQTAKNVFLWPSRSWIRKGMEAYFTVLIEFFWSKDRILEVYLNVIELGKGVYGVEAASKKFFHKKAKQLTGSEAALIAAVLPNPIKFKINKPSAYVLRRQQKIMGPAQVEVQFDVDDDVDETEVDSEATTETATEPDSGTQVSPSP